MHHTTSWYLEFYHAQYKVRSNTAQAHFRDAASLQAVSWDPILTCTQVPALVWFGPVFRKNFAGQPRMHRLCFCSRPRSGQVAEHLLDWLDSWRTYLNYFQILVIKQKQSRLLLVQWANICNLLFKRGFLHRSFMFYSVDFHPGTVFVLLQLVNLIQFAIETLSFLQPRLFYLVFMHKQSLFFGKASCLFISKVFFA